MWQINLVFRFVNRKENEKLQECLSQLWNWNVFFVKPPCLENTAAIFWNIFWKSFQKSLASSTWDGVALWTSISPHIFTWLGVYVSLEFVWAILAFSFYSSGFCFMIAKYSVPPHLYINSFQLPCSLKKTIPKPGATCCTPSWERNITCSPFSWPCCVVSFF